MNRRDLIRSAVGALCAPLLAWMPKGKRNLPPLERAVKLDGTEQMTVVVYSGPCSNWPNTYTVDWIQAKS